MADTIHDILRRRLLDAAGLTREVVRADPTELERTEWCEEFERLQRNRLIIGALRYGRLGAPGKPQWDRVPDMIRRLEAYQADGNLEHLVDVANLAMAAFVEDRHPERHFAAADDGQHTMPK
jgi:hypothetical protein